MYVGLGDGLCNQLSLLVPKLINRHIKRMVDRCLGYFNTHCIYLLFEVS